jgi:hypothetical protein
MTPLMGLLTRGRYYIKQVDDGIAEPRYDAQGTRPSPFTNALAVRKSTNVRT